MFCQAPPSICPSSTRLLGLVGDGGRPRGTLLCGQAQLEGRAVPSGTSGPHGERSLVPTRPVTDSNYPVWWARLPPRRPGGSGAAVPGTSAGSNALLSGWHVRVPSVVSKLQAREKCCPNSLNKSAKLIGLHGERSQDGLRQRALRVTGGTSAAEDGRTFRGNTAGQAGPRLVAYVLRGRGEAGAGGLGGCRGTASTCKTRPGGARQLSASCFQSPDVSHTSRKESTQLTNRPTPTRAFYTPDNHTFRREERWPSGAAAPRATHAPGAPHTPPCPWPHTSSTRTARPHAPRC